MLQLSFHSKISLRQSHKTGKKVLYGLSALISLFFIVLLLLPGSPSQLDTLSYIFLIAWVLAGLFVYWRSEKREKLGS